MEYVHVMGGPTPVDIRVTSLYSLYINDLANSSCILDKAVLADDINLFLSHKLL